MKIFIAFCVSAILGAFISLYPYWILMLHTLAITMLGMAIGYLGYELKEYGIIDSDDWKIGFWCLGISLFIGILIVKFVGTPILYTVLYCITIPAIITAFKVLEVDNEIVDYRYVRVALVSGFFATLLFTFIINGWMSLVSGGIVGISGMLGTIFFISPFFRWTVAVLGWIGGCIVFFSGYYYVFQNWEECENGEIWWLIGCSYGYYRLGKFLFIKWWIALPRRQRVTAHPPTSTPRKQPPVSRPTQVGDVDIKFIKAPTSVSSSIDDLIKISPLKKIPSTTTITSKPVTPHKGISAEARLITEDRVGCRCPVCHEVFNLGDWVIHCPVCDAIYHDKGEDDNCWKFNGGCAVPYCKGKGTVH